MRARPRYPAIWPTTARRSLKSGDDLLQERKKIKNKKGEMPWKLELKKKKKTKLLAPLLIVVINSSFFIFYFFLFFIFHSLPTFFPFSSSSLCLRSPWSPTTTTFFSAPAFNHWLSSLQTCLRQREPHYRRNLLPPKTRYVPRVPPLFFFS